MSNKNHHWIDKFATRCAVLYPETWALQNRDLIMAQKYEYVTTRGLVNATTQEIDRALDIWKSKNKFCPKPCDLVEYLELARAELKREQETEAAKRALPPQNEYLSAEVSQEVQRKVEEFRKNNPNASWLDVIRAARQGAFKCR